MFNPFKRNKKRKGAFSFILGRFSFKTKLIIFLVLTFIGMIFGLILFTIGISELEEIDKKVPDITENTSRPIYSGNQAKVSVTDTTTQQMQFEDVISQDFSANEAQVLAALNKILGGTDSAALSNYFGWDKQYVKGSVPQLIVPAICEQMKFKVRGDLSISQGIHELGYNHKASGTSGRTSDAWRYHNAHGIKAGYAPNEWWDGKTERTATGEGVGGTQRIKDDFCAFKDFYHAFMFHGWMLTTTSRYKPLGLQNATSCVDWATRLKSVGYYTDSVSNYVSEMNSIYSKCKLDKFQNLYNLVVQEIAKSGGAYTTPTGTTIPNGEWKPQPVIQTNTKWGYFVDPSKGSISSCFARRINPVTHKTEIHRGLDFAVPTGTTIYAARSGVVYESRLSSSYGNVVTIDHGDGFYTRYAHNSKLLVNKGDKVVKGQEIAKSGSTGQSSGPHSHFEVIKGDPTVRENRTNPLSTFYEKFMLNGKETVKPRGAGAFNSQKVTEDPGTISGENASASAGFNKNKPTTSSSNLVQACSFLKEQGIDPATLSKERLAVFYEGHKWFGSWYAWGGKTPPKKNSDGSWQMPHRTGGWSGGYALAGPGFDCSGYVGWIFKQVFGVNIGYGSYEQGHSKYAKLIDTDATKPGDIYWHDGHITIAVKVDSKYVYVMQSPQTGEKIGWGKFRRSQAHRIVRPTFYKD